MRARQTTAGAAGLALVAVLAALLALVPPRRPGGLSAPERAAAAQPAPASRRSDVTVTDIQLGRAVDLDKRIAQAAEVFDPRDVVYVSVVTQGSAEHARLTARWKRQGETVAEVTQTIAPTSTAVSEFNAWKPRGWPPGEYEVEILVDGAAQGSRRFTVR